MRHLTNPGRNIEWNSIHVYVFSEMGWCRSCTEQQTTSYIDARNSSNIEDSFFEDSSPYTTAIV